MICGKELVNDEEMYCRDCRKRDHLFTRCFSLWDYDECMRRSIAGFKYNSRREYADFYVQSMLERFGDAFERLAFDGIIPVPIHRKKLLSRGYNQAELIAEGLAEALHVPLLSDLLVRDVNTTPQKELGPAARLRNLRSAFSVNVTSPSYDRFFDKVLLVDDIFTTGSTADACTDALLRSGGIGEVYMTCLCVGRDN